MSRNMSQVLVLAILLTLSPVHAVTLLQVLQNYSELSSLYSYVNASSGVTSFLAAANNFTFLAPSNTAIAKYIFQNPHVLTEDLLEATFQYSLLQGRYPSLPISGTPQIVHSSLANATYTNVTGGQTVQLARGSDGTLEILSGNKTTSASTTEDIVCSGGIVHIVDTVLSIPATAVSEITAVNLQYFVSILNVGNYLDTRSNKYVEKALEARDVTYFIPNSAAALSNATELAKTSSGTEMQAMFEYHIVPGFVGYSSLLTDNISLKTAQGDNLTVTIRDREKYVNNARIIASDYIVANGIVHVIDNLLNHSDTVPPTAKPSSPGLTNWNTSSTNGLFTSPTPTVLPLAASTTHAPTTTLAISISVGVSFGVIILVAVIVFLLLRRAQRIKRAEAALARECQSSPDSMATDEKRKDMYVHREFGMDKELEEYCVPPLRVHTMGMNHFQSMQRDSIGGAPYIPDKSPSRRIARDQGFF